MLWVIFHLTDQFPQSEIFKFIALSLCVCVIVVAGVQGMRGGEKERLAVFLHASVERVLEVSCLVYKHLTFLFLAVLLGTPTVVFIMAAHCNHH